MQNNLKKQTINYDDSSSNAAAKITQQVQARIQNCLDYIRYAKQNNIDIFKDNTDTGVDDEDGEIQGCGKSMIYRIYNTNQKM